MIRLFCLLHRILTELCLRRQTVSKPRQNLSFVIIGITCMSDLRFIQLCINERIFWALIIPSLMIYISIIHILCLCQILVAGKTWNFQCCQWMKVIRIIDFIVKLQLIDYCYFVLYFPFCFYSSQRQKAAVACLKVCNNN